MKNILCKHDKEKKLDAELTKKIQYIRSRFDGITWFVICNLIQRNVTKAEKKIIEKHTEKGFCALPILNDLKIHD